MDRKVIAGPNTRHEINFELRELQNSKELRKILEEAGLMRTSTPVTRRREESMEPYYDYRAEKKFKEAKFEVQKAVKERIEINKRRGELQDLMKKLKVTNEKRLRGALVDMYETHFKAERAETERLKQEAWVKEQDAATDREKFDNATLKAPEARADVQEEFALLKDSGNLDAAKRARGIDANSKHTDFRLRLALLEEVSKQREAFVGLDDATRKLVQEEFELLKKDKAQLSAAKAKVEVDTDSGLRMKLLEAVQEQQREFAASGPRTRAAVLSDFEEISKKGPEALAKAKADKNVFTNSDLKIAILKDLRQIQVDSRAKLEQASEASRAEVEAEFKRLQSDGELEAFRLQYDVRFDIEVKVKILEAIEARKSAAHDVERRFGFDI